MKAVFSKFNSPKDEREFTALAFYTAAVCEMERSHMPIIGSSVDRRLFTMVCRLSNSTQIHSSPCFCCAQSWTAVKMWNKRLTKDADSVAGLYGNSSPLQQHSVRY